MDDCHRAGDALVAGMLAKFDAGDGGSTSYANRPAVMPERMISAGLRYGKEFQRFLRSG